MKNLIRLAAVVIVLFAFSGCMEDVTPEMEQPTVVVKKDIPKTHSDTDSEVELGTKPR